MTPRYPDYPRDSSGEIPDPLCFDLIRIWPEHGGAYLWDMNGVSSMIADVLDPRSENPDLEVPLDKELAAWQEHYEWKPINKEAGYIPIWDSEEEQIQFDEDGKVLAKKVYDFFDGRNTVVYYPTRGGEFRWDAVDKPPIRI